MLSHAGIALPFSWGCSSYGRALTLHVRGTGIDALLLHSFFLRASVLVAVDMCVHASSPCTLVDSIDPDHTFYWCVALCDATSQTDSTKSSTVRCTQPAPMPTACKAVALPFELHPQAGCDGSSSVCGLHEHGRECVHSCTPDLGMDLHHVLLCSLEPKTNCTCHV